MSNTRPDARLNQFNPGYGAQTRFALFGNPAIPVLYCAESEASALSETLLRDIPYDGGELLPSDYQRLVMGRLAVQRSLKLASFRGTGLRSLGIEAKELTETDDDRYDETVPWADAAHRAGFDGIVWTSRRCNSDAAFMFFGDRVAESDLAIDAGFGRAFATADDIDWLTDFCVPLRVEVQQA